MDGVRGPWERILQHVYVRQGTEQNRRLNKVLILLLFLLLILIGLQLQQKIASPNNQTRKAAFKTASNSEERNSPQNNLPQDCISGKYEYQHRFTKSPPLVVSQIEFDEIRSAFLLNEMLPMVPRIPDKILKKAVASDRSVEVYITSNYKSPEVRSVYLYYPSTSVATRIYQMTTQEFENQEFTRRIVDIGLSHDNSLLAITESEGMKLYSLQSKEMETAFSRPVDVNKRVEIYNYQEPIFSPDNTKILVNKGHYEGLSQLLYDIASRQITDLDYFTYTGGEWAVGWYKDQLVLLRHNGDYTLEDSTESLYLVNTQTLLEMPILSNITNIEGFVLLNDKFYMLNRTYKDSGVMVCDKENSLYELQSNFNEVHVVDLAQKTQKHLVTTDETTYGNMGKGIRIESMRDISIQNERKIIIKTVEGAKNNYYVVDAAKPGVLQPIIVKP